jgi:hypothetical protein
LWVPRFVLLCSEALVRGAVERAAETGALVHTHAAEHRAERAAVRAAYGASDVALLRRWGLRGRRASLAHGVQLTAAERRHLAADGTGVVHCPSANLKLGSGVADVAALIAAGVVVGLGPDGAPCNNNLDPWVELRHAALLASLRAGPGVVPARRVLRLATLDGARACSVASTISDPSSRASSPISSSSAGPPPPVPEFDPSAPSSTRRRRATSPTSSSGVHCWSGTGSWSPSTRSGRRRALGSRPRGWRGAPAFEARAGRDYLGLRLVMSRQDLALPIVPGVTAGARGLRPAPPVPLPRGSAGAHCRSACPCAGSVETSWTSVWWRGIAVRACSSIARAARPVRRAYRCASPSRASSSPAATGGRSARVTPR